MENNHLRSRFDEGLVQLGVSLPAGAVQKLLTFQTELLRWNQKVNLTAIVDEEEFLEKHLLDSLAILPDAESAESVLDLGSGAGLPGVPLAVALPGMKVTLVDAVAKKVAFIKHAIALLALAPRCRAVHQRVQGHPTREGIPLANLVICRALMDVPAWLRLATPYIAEGGRAAAMLGRASDEGELGRSAAEAGYSLEAVRAFRLPFSGAQRAIALFRPTSTA